MDSHRLNFLSQFHQHPHRNYWVLFYGLSTLVFLGLLAFGWLMQLPPLTIARGVEVNGTPIGQLPREQAVTLLESQSFYFPEYLLTVVHNDQVWEKTSSELGLHADVEKTLDSAMQIGRQGALEQQMTERFRSHFQTTTVLPVLAYDETAVSTWIASISAEIDQAGRLPQAKLVAGQVRIDTGELGLAVDQTSLAQEILHNPGQTKKITAQVEATIVPLSSDGLIAAQKRLEKLRTLKIVLEPSAEEKKITLTAAQFFPWLRLPDGYAQETMSAALTELTQQWNQEPQEAVLELNAAQTKATTFIPPRNGRAVAIDVLVDQLQTEITKYENTPEASGVITTTVPFNETLVQVTLEKTNSLGITERIGVGTSEFAGSIPNRIHNVALTAKNLHGTVIKPGEEFSFNAAIGDVSQATGYKTAYIIQNGRTELGDGGGVCQVSTTLFRSLLNAGLPITRWKPHSYRVGYYEQNSQPGFDATVYSPSTDLRFKNDTNSHIVVATYPDTHNTFLKVELWGTSDGRSAEISDYTIWNQSSAPAPLFLPDASIAPGSRKQIDWAAPGASTKFHYKVVSKSGEVIQERDFTSHFKPWQAIYLVGP